MSYKYKQRDLPNISKSKLEKITGITLFSNYEFFNKDEHQIYKQLLAYNQENKDFGFHYLIDDDSDTIYQLISNDYQAKNIKGKPTYISRGVFKEKPEESTLSVYIAVSEKNDYEKLEKKLIKFIVSLLKEHHLTAKDVWRGFDLGKETYSPYHLFQKEVFEKFIKELEKFVPPVDNSGGETEGIPQDAEEVKDEKKEEEENHYPDESKITIESPFKELAEKEKVSVSEYVYKIYKENQDPAKYAAKFQVWDKGVGVAQENTSVSGDLQSRETPYKNLLQYKITENAPLNLDHCEKPVDQLDAIETSQKTMVEPIYPDLISPPGGDIHIADGFSETKVQSSSNTPLTAEEFEKRQKTFDLEKFSNMKKETKGRPVNTEDPFPVDDQIEKLEQHVPKVKVDKVTFNLKDTNHPNSEIGNALAKNAAMCYDMVTEVAKRTEQRLVKLENNLSTVMRNLFRLSSRININCVYYGGQSVYGKYRCIRCLHDDRINDGDVVTIDQCMNCTRYEPVLGQVYAILDETGSNIVQVMDDLQMSYMGLGDYKDLNSIDKYHQSLGNAKVNQHPSEKPKTFIEDKWKDSKKELEEKEKQMNKEEQESKPADGSEAPKNDNAEKENKEKDDKKEEKKETPVNGFKMDWNPTPLETQKPNINKYDAEKLKIDKKAIKSNVQKIDRDIFIDTREKAVEYEKLEFDIKDYEFPDFGENNNGGAGGQFGMGAAEVRNKIVSYAMAAVELCKNKKAWYSQPQRNSHGPGYENGMQYWDCSSLVRDAYKEAGLGIIGQLTYDQFDNCKNSAGGMLFPITEQANALPGDIVFFNDAYPEDLSTEKLQSVPNNGVRHVAIYTGDGMIAHACSPKWGIVHTTINWDKGSFCFGRPKVLIELDKSAGSGDISTAWSREAQGISDELWNAAKVADSNVQGFISNMKKYGYRDALVKISQEKKFDPYFIASIISIETSGDPMCGGGYPGIMQSSSGFQSSTIEGISENIRRGCDDLRQKANDLKRYGWVETNPHVLATAHNCGQWGTLDALGHTHETRRSVPIPMLGKVVDMSSCKIPEVADMITQYVKKFQRGWSSEEKRTYATKVLRAYNKLYQQNVLNLPRPNANGNGNIPLPGGMPPIQRKQIRYNYGRRTSPIKYIVIHDTQNNGGTAQNHFDYFNNGKRGASADYFVDSSNIIEISDPNNYYTFHCGDGHGKYGISNQNSVGIELCLERNGSISSNTFNHGILLAKHLMQKYNVPKSNVVRHYDASRKDCPNNMKPNGWKAWNDFKSKL